ncbi:hypothetical protein K466DRAFT_660836 [Polyporus arcularius HHB13444]|uniref:Uncharacterized protein n=1 Tax=Polyporus arcularius HHB13444 TaxID=1314778 RepID=A0A5C3PKV1_9APHY|nr:hypothetical protein K466DRAFT_660836 [Polyporus arcularius HHB13444]
MSSTSLSLSISASSHPEGLQSSQVPRTPKRRRAHTFNEGRSSTDPTDRPRLARPACRENSLSEEVFETRFENPFKAISRGFGQRRERGSTHRTSIPSQPREASPRKSANLRVVLSSLRHSFSSSGSGDGSAGSPGTTISSQSTSDSSASSASSSSEPEDCIRNGVQRTDPYGPPYYADAPPCESPRSVRSRISSISSFGGMSIALSMSSSIFAYGTPPGPEASPSSGKLSAAAAIADAARREILPAVKLETGSTHR